MDGRQLEKNIERSSGCFRCPVQCKANLKLDHMDTDELFTRPEFEPVINLGPKCGLDDLNQIIKAVREGCGRRLVIDETTVFDMPEEVSSELLRAANG